MSSSVLGSINLNQEQFNGSPNKSKQVGVNLSPGKNYLQGIDFGNEDCSSGGFQFKLTQITSRKPGFEEESEKKSLVKEETSSLEQSFMNFDAFIREQRKELPFKLSQKKSEKEKQMLIDEFFDRVELEKNKVMQNLANSKLKQKSPGKKLKKSPTKSPNKKSRNADENISPTKNSESSYVSPTAKKAPVQNESPPTREKDEDISKYLSVQESQESQKASCKLSPLKRMKNLEEQENLENQENIEQTYHKSPESRISTTDVDSSEENPEQLSETHNMKPMFEEETKSLLQSKETFQEPPPEGKLITDILDVDSNVINYGQFICGKILGSTLLLSNISEQDQIVTMQISKKKSFDCNEIFGQYNREELPFTYVDGTSIVNAEIDFNCWFIENPVSKELQKQITLKIGPGMSQEFIIVVKAPKNKLEARIVSFIDITLTDDVSASSQTEKHVNHNKERVVLKEQPISRKMDVLLLGYLDNPKIKCMKQLFNKQTNTEIVQLAVRKCQGIQKFKLPFKNMSSYLDSDVEFAFIRTQVGKNQLNEPNDKLDPIECFSFYCQPNQLKIASDQISILTVQVKVNTDLLNNAEKVDQRLLKYPLNKLLVARLKNSQVLFSFFVSITLVESE